MSWLDRALCAHLTEAKVPWLLDDGTTDVVEAWWWEVERGPAPPQRRAAVDICGRCPVSQECLDDEEDSDSAMIRGGLTPRERRRTRRSAA